MRVLQLIGSLSPSTGGPAAACLGLSKELAKRGHQVTIYTTNLGQAGSGPAKDLEAPLDGPIYDQGVELRFFPGIGKGHYALSMRLLSALRATITQFDVVHIHSMYIFHATAGAFVCTRYRVPYVIKPHGTLDPFLRSKHRIRKWLHEMLVERWSFRNAAAIQFTAVEEKELAERSFAGRRLFSSSRGVIIPNAVIIPEAVDAQDCQPDVERLLATFPELRGKEIVLFLGRINFKKGLDILAEAFGQIRRNRDKSHLLIAGPDNEGYGERVRGWLRAQGVLSSVTFAGMLLGGAKEAAFRIADVFVLPSYTENFGIAVVEAMARKVPVVVSNRVNIWHEIEGAAAGIVVEPQSDAVVRCVIRVLDDRKLRRQLGQNGFELVRREYTWQGVGDKTVALYEQAMLRDSANA